jgi:aspartate oxidase
MAFIAASMFTWKLHRDVAEGWRTGGGRLWLRTARAAVQGVSGQAVVLATAGSAGLQDHEQQLGLHRRRPFPAYHAGAELIDMEFVQFHPTAWSGRRALRHARHEGVRGEGGILNKDGKRSCSIHPDNYKAQTATTRGRLALLPG